jgi:hypothetical protein
MYFGGEIISATDCNYQTSRDLGLVCPFCSSAVFIRSESVREIKGKLQLVRPYFAHYPSGSPDNWDCEKRSRTKQGREEVERIKVQARNQRLKLYNAHLWDMFATDRNVSHQKLNKVRSRFGDRWCEERSILTRFEWGKSLDSVYTMIDELVQKETDLKHSDIAPYMDEQDFNEEREKQLFYFLDCDIRLHRTICCEIADFLGTNTGGFAFLKFFKTALFVESVYSDIAEIKRNEPRLHIYAIAGLLAGTHWIEQIQQRI